MDVEDVGKFEMFVRDSLLLAADVILAVVNFESGKG